MSRRPFRLGVPRAPELDLQTAAADAFDKLLRPPATWTAFPAGHIKLDGQQAARLARIGMSRNWPDHLVLYAGKLIGIEWKMPGGRLTKSRWVRTRHGAKRWVEGQDEGFRKLQAAGMRGPYVCTSLEQALLALEGEGVPMLRWRITAGQGDK